MRQSGPGDDVWGTREQELASWAVAVEVLAKVIAPSLAPVPTFCPLRDGSVFLKCELCQPGGSVWGRGALALLSSVRGDRPCFSIVSGGPPVWCEAAAYASSSWSRPCTVAVPFDTPASAVRRVQAWEADLVYRGKDDREASDAAERIALSTGGAFLNPRIGPEMLMGFATLGVEILSEFADLGTLVLAGPRPAVEAVGAYLRCRKPGVRVVEATKGTARGPGAHRWDEPSPAVRELDPRGRDGPRSSGPVVVANLG